MYANTIPQATKLNVRELWCFPLDDPHWQRVWLVGGLLLLLWPLVVPVVLVSGYLVALARLHTQNPPANACLPGWGNAKVYARDGVRLLTALLLFHWPVLLVVSTVVVGRLVIGGPLAQSDAAPVLVWVAIVAQQVGLIWAAIAFLLFPLHLRQAAAGRSLREVISPRRLAALARANLRALPRIWLRQLALFLLSFSGIAIALIGWPFTAFWALLALARLASETALP